MLQEKRRGPPTRARTGNFLYLYILPGRSSPINRRWRADNVGPSVHTRVQHAEFRSRIHAETSVKDAESRQPVGPRLIGGLLKLTCRPDSPRYTREGRDFATLTPGLINPWNFLSLFCFYELREREKGISLFIFPFSGYGSKRNCALSCKFRKCLTFITTISIENIQVKIKSSRIYLYILRRDLFWLR